MSNSPPDDPEAQAKLRALLTMQAAGAWQRPKATPATLQKLLNEGRITPVEFQQGVTPLFSDFRMNGWQPPDGE
jgi:hypothetical protein